MADMNETQVIIAGKVLTLTGYETAEYTQKVANYKALFWNSPPKFFIPM